MLLREFEARVNRERGFRSGRLTTLIGHINCFVASPSLPGLAGVRRALDEWRQRDRKEFANRGQPLIAELERELDAAQALCPRPGMITIVDLAAHPRFEPDDWRAARIAHSANCYAYACNDPDGHAAGELPQPALLMWEHRSDRLLAHAESVLGALRFPDGRATQAPLAYRHRLLRERVRLDNVARAARGHPVMSRLEGSEQPGFQPTNIHGHYLVALFVSAKDFHWLRQDDTGYWSHKTGQHVPIDRDMKSKRIQDPRDAALGDYQFSAFYRVPKGGVRTSGFPPAGRLSAEQSRILVAAFPSAEAKPEHSVARVASDRSRSRHPSLSSRSDRAEEKEEEKSDS